MSEARVEPTVVVLSSMVWRAELEAELQRIGVPPELAQRTAGHLLGRIVRHAGYLDCFVYDEPDDVDRVGGTTHRALARRPR